MGGFFGAVSKNDTVLDVFFGTDYHSHLGTRRGGMAAYDEKKGLQRKIHKIENSPFRTKFENISSSMKGNAAIGSISDSDAQPLLVRSKLGLYAICIIGLINNREELVENFLFSNGGHFGAVTNEGINSTELVAALINQKDSFAEGIAYAQGLIDGTASILILTDDGRIITGKTSSLLGCSAAMLLNALKAYAGIEDGRHLISPEVITPIQQLKVEHMGSKNPRLHTDEILLALSICAATDENAAKAMAQLKRLRGCEMHVSVMLSHVDESLLKKLGVNLTSEPEHQGQKLYRKK
jgi:hypothetical protein